MARIVLLAAAMLCVCAGTPAAQAQDSLLQELYGRGVHAYFSGDYQRASQSLSAAIEQGFDDPRCFYFRGLSESALGRSKQATDDFRRGAELEMTPNGALVSIGRALERVQGYQRLEIERIRDDVRLEARLSQVRRDKARYEELQRAEAEVLRDPNRQPPANLPELTPTTPVAPSDPFAAGKAGDLGSGEAVEAAAAPAAGTARPADPFGGPMDPFGGQPSATPAAPADPFGGGAPAPAAPGANMPADPFGGGAPAPTPAPAGADPF
ncbi:MAG: hypothetical protein J5I93_26280, partial [Pirellulaceae bacterium]|nr:hypothetical protein [Pirellulaceae bacterium]